MRLIGEIFFEDARPRLTEHGVNFLAQVRRACEVVEQLHGLCDIEGEIRPANRSFASMQLEAGMLTQDKQRGTFCAERPLAALLIETIQ